MNKLILIVLLLAIVEGCTKEDRTSTTPIDEVIDTTGQKLRKWVSLATDLRAGYRALQKSTSKTTSYYWHWWI